MTDLEHVAADHDEIWAAYLANLEALQAARAAGKAALIKELEAKDLELSIPHILEVANPKL